jgi:hypothetical protein
MNLFQIMKVCFISCLACRGDRMYNFVYKLWAWKFNFKINMVCESYVWYMPLLGLKLGPGKGMTSLLATTSTMGRCGILTTFLGLGMVTLAPCHFLPKCHCSPVLVTGLRPVFQYLHWCWACQHQKPLPTAEVTPAVPEKMPTSLLPIATTSIVEWVFHIHHGVHYDHLVF